MKHIKTLETVNESATIDLASERENQAKIKDDISKIKTSMSAIDKTNKTDVDKNVMKSKLLSQVARKTMDLAKSIDKEAKLLFASTKEKPVTI